MQLKEILLVTFPVDLGNRTLEANQHAIFKNDMDFYRFAEKHAYDIDYGSVSIRKSLIYRIRSSFTLRKIVGEYTKAGKTVLFNGLSPALFAYGKWKPEQTAIVFDWTRTLYNSVRGELIRKNWIFLIHRKVLKHCPKFLCWTDAVMENLINVYGVEESALYKVPAPFLIEQLNIPPRPTPQKPRVLFVGGDFTRKGGDVLIEAWKASLSKKCSLSMVTNDNRANIEGVNFLSGIRYGSDIHRKIFEEHDILILPAKMDAYPQVIGEAAAAGLALVTTKFALGANEIIIDGVTGYIAHTPEESILRLEYLLDKPMLIDDFKNKGYELMQRKFSKELIRKKYLEIINGKI